jgi:hypothetical protein
MPRKTNDFQALIALLHRQLASPETSVSESGFITDPATGDLREVDVLIEQAVAGYPAKIAVECRDRSRAATVQWIDELIGKYQNTGIKVVAESKRGFAKRAKIRAEKAGIEAVTATDAVARDWAAWIASMPTIVIEMERLDLAAVELILGPELSNEDLPPPRADSRLRLVAGGEWTTPLRLYDRVTQGPSSLASMSPERLTTAARPRSRLDCQHPPCSSCQVGDWFTRMAFVSTGAPQRN